MSLSQEIRRTPAVGVSIWDHQDDCLVSIEDGEPVRARSLMALPPWRAVLIAIIAEKANVPLERGNAKQVIDEAWVVGGEGKLGSWWERKS